MATTDAPWNTCARLLRDKSALTERTFRLLTGDEIRSMYPQLRGDDIIGGSFCSAMASLILTAR